MLDRQFIPPLSSTMLFTAPAIAGVGGLPRTSAIAGLAGASSVLEVERVAPEAVEATAPVATVPGRRRSSGGDSGGGDGEGRRGGEDADDVAGDGTIAEGDAAEPTDASEPAEAAEPADAAGRGLAEGEAAAREGSEGGPAGAASATEEPMDLSGYGAYEKAPGPGAGMSRDELVQRYAHLVKYVVGRLGVSVPGLFDHEDAMQAGVLGLLRAIDAYRPDAAASFESYAILRIRGSILDAVRSLDSVGRAGREAARAIQGAIRDLQHELGRSPSETEVANRLGLSVTRYRDRLQAASIVTVSLDERDARDGDDEPNVLADNAADPNAIDPADEASRKDAIASLVHEIGRLSTRARTVLGLYYQDEMTFKEIGQVLGVTESRVCQIHTEAILSLRSRLVDPDIAARLGRRRARA